MWPASKSLRAHTRVVWDLLGRGLDGEPLPMQIRLVEAAIYEDMASLWNLIHERANAEHVDTLLRERKTLLALCRAAVAAAVHFVEAYLNGLAFDHLASHENDVSDDDRSALFEWDFKKTGSRFLSLREKVLRYQRIILNVQHAPVQPSNCAELATLLGIVEGIRNPLAHPGPHISPRSGLPDKELAIFDITVATVREAVDVAIAAVRRLEEAVHGNLLAVDWLRSRTSEGTFPPEAFD